MFSSYTVPMDIFFLKRQGTLSWVGFPPIKPLYLPMFLISSKDFDMWASQQCILDKTLREPDLTNKLSPCPKKTNDRLRYMTVQDYKAREKLCRSISRPMCLQGFLSSDFAERILWNALFNAMGVMTALFSDHIRPSACELHTLLVS